MKERGEPMKGSKLFKEFIENTSSTRRSTISKTDTKRLTQIETTELLARFFKANNDIFLKLIKFPYERLGR